MGKARGGGRAASSSGFPGMSAGKKGLATPVAMQSPNGLFSALTDALYIRQLGA